MIGISRRGLAHAVGERLLEVTNATGYFGQIGALYPLPGAGSPPSNDPPPKAAGDPRVKPYFIVFPGIGRPGSEVDLGEALVDLDWPVAVTAVGADVDDVLALADRIDNLLHRWTPDVAGCQTGPLRYPSGAVPPLLTDNAVRPPRLFVPLQYQLTAHT